MPDKRFLSWVGKKGGYWMLGPVPGNRDRDDGACPRRNYSWVEQSDL